MTTAEVSSKKRQLSTGPDEVLQEPEQSPVLVVTTENPRKDKMCSKRVNVCLTENGVRLLFDVSVKTTLNMQVLFLFEGDELIYLRLSDGKHVTPIIALFTANFKPEFFVGAVLAIKGVRYEPPDFELENPIEMDHLLNDRDFSLLIITSYSFLADGCGAGGLIGTLNTSTSYKDAIRHILPILKKYDHNFRFIEKNYKKAQSEANKLREQGNSFFGEMHYEKALVHYDMAKGNDPFDYRLWSNSSQAHFHLEEFEEAQDEAVIAIKMNPFSDKAYYWAGQAALKLNRYEEAGSCGQSGQYMCGHQKNLRQLVQESDRLEEEDKMQAEVKPEVPNNKTKKNGSRKAFNNSMNEDEENVDPNKKKALEEAEPIKKETKEKTKDKKEKQAKKVLKAAAEENHKEEEKKKNENRLLEEARKKQANETLARNNEVVSRNITAESTDVGKDKGISSYALEAKLQDRNTKSKNLYHDALKDGRRFYETNQFKQALETFGKVLAYSCPEGDKSAKNGYSGCQDLLEIQFVVGACKVQANLIDILDGMDTMRIFCCDNSAFEAPASARYFMAVAYEKLCLNKMVQSESLECATVLKTPKHKAFRWPGSDDLFPESDPPRLKMFNDELHKRNRNWYAQEESIAAWRGLPLDPSVARRFDAFHDFQDKHNYMEMIVKNSIEKTKREFLGMFSRGEHSKGYRIKVVRPGGHLIGRTSSIKPTPKAKCRFKDCVSTQGHLYAKEEIYDTDPDFKGFVDVICEECCTVTYHPCCWKEHKEQLEDQFGKMSDKDFLGTECVTPDCTGKINAILIHDESCSLKHELLANKKDKKNASTPVKQKKKKEKKKTQPAKPQPEVKDKRKGKTESVSEDYVHIEETAVAPPPPPPPAVIKPETPSKGNNNTQNTEKEKVPLPASTLPIDPESLDKVTVVIKPTVEEETVPQSKTSKKKKKNKKPKEIIQPDLLGDPLEAETSSTNDYVARLRILKQQREAQELDAQNLPRTPGGGQTYRSPSVNLTQWLDPENPFYLPQHLRDNPEELERILQTKMISSSSPNLENSTITTLLEFVYEWLKMEGPMSINDDRLRQYVQDHFPPEALEHVNHCGGIKQFLMQSIDFAMIDEVICVRDHVVRAQELTKKTVSERMMTSKFLISDGRKARKFTHLLDDTKSSCSSCSSTSMLLGSGVSSYNSRTTSDSNVPVLKAAVDPVKLDLTKPKPKSEGMNELNTFTKGELSKPNVNQHKTLAKIGGLSGLDDFEVPLMSLPKLKELSPSESQDSNDVYDEEDADEDSEDEAEEVLQETARETGNSHQESLKSQMKAGKEIQITSHNGNEESDIMSQNVDLKSSITNQNGDFDVLSHGGGEQYQSDEDEEEAEDEDNSVEESEVYVESLKDEMEELKRGMKMLNEQNQKLNDKLIQVKSSTNIEISSLKRKVEELSSEKRELEAEKHSLAAARESEARRFKAEMSRMQDEVRSFQSRHTSLEHKFERSLDRLNEIDAKLIEEQEVSSQLREEVKNLQESLTSSSRRAHEAEVKYLCIKKDLSETHLNRTIDRLTAEVLRMRQLLHHASEDSIPDRSTLTRSIIAWDESIKSLRERKSVFMEEGKRLLGMVNQGRPLNALPPGDLDIPTIPDINIAPLLIIVPNAKKQPITATGIELAQERQLGRTGSPSLPPPPPTTPTLAVDSGIMPISHGGPPGFEHPKATLQKVNTVAAFSSGAIPKGTLSSPTTSCTITATDGSAAQKYPDSHKLFIGKIPWDYCESDVKRLFSELIGEVVGVTVYDKGYTPDGKAVPKYGFVTFRNADDQEKALNYGPIMVGNHALNIQAKEAKKPTKPTNIAVGAGPPRTFSEPVTTKSGPSAYGLSDISLNATSEANNSVAARSLSTPSIPQANATPVTKPKFQNLTSTNSVGAIGTLPPKLVRPQPRQPTNGKGGNQSNSALSGAGAAAATGKEESAAYKRLIEVCKQRLGREFAAVDITNGLREVRMKNSNSLSGLSIDVIVDNVRQRLKARRPGSGQASVAPWAGLTQGPAGKSGGPDWQGPTSGKLPTEEQCSICLEALNSSPTLQLQCQHVFHGKCIGDWLKRQSNCPNCRTFALMADEYPSLKH